MLGTIGEIIFSIMNFYKKYKAIGITVYLLVLDAGFVNNVLGP